jgi:methionyl-tRNA formyltransferase
MPETRILFMGTPDFAVPSLAALHANGPRQNWRVVAVATQPDRPAGRGKKLLASPVKQLAQEQGLPVLQPARLRKQPDAVAQLRELAPDLIVVAAYGLILPASVLEIPTHGCINVHASLLPAYRGASPINAAILDGRVETGISIMLMDEGMDTGPVLAQARQPIHPDDTALTLGERLAQQGADLLVETLPGWLAGEVPPIPQSELPGEPSTCRLIKKDAGRIDWNAPAAQIERMTRAYVPWPSAFTTWRGQPFKIWQAEVVEGEAEPGRVVETPRGPAVGAGEQLLLLQRVQPAGKRAMPVQDFLNGAPDFVGSRLGEQA